jgi:DNA-directed RNA polymerase subunit RPC12/RpoP
MTTKNPVGYCPHCQQNVLLTRGEIDVCLAIVLLIFTAGIGLIIYLAIYYSKAEDRCVHCGTQISSIISQPSGQLSYQPQNVQREISPQNIEQIQGERVYYCSFCGEKIVERGIKFCPNCGSKIEYN